MIKKKQIISLVILLMINIPVVFAGVTAGFEFLRTDFSPRSSSMSGANITLRDDITTMFVNPAGMADCEPKQFSINYTNHILDIGGGSIAYSHQFPVIGAINFGINYFDYGNFEETDNNAIKTGNQFSVIDFAFGIGIARHLDQDFTYGINLKYAYSKIENYNASAMALDFGLIYDAPFQENLRFAVTLLNLGANFKYYGDLQESLPLSLNIGASKKLAHLPLEIALSFQNLTDTAEDMSDYLKRFSIGGEFKLSEPLRLRLGYSHRLHESLATHTEEKFGGITAGIGFIWKTLRFDYSYSNQSSLGSIQRFGIMGRLW
ncbi:MAG: type IX secretion system protein PorQ [Calditrichaceae bacterium]|nr:type IX secretion system protein PorQ [Calditrichaceae bacterium]MBN2709163.1 type IX secretion system protein PorQ [Calditrichaceae bacterium]